MFYFIRVNFIRCELHANKYSYKLFTHLRSESPLSWITARIDVTFRFQVCFAHISLSDSPRAEANPVTHSFLLVSPFYTTKITDHYRSARRNHVLKGKSKLSRVERTKTDPASQANGATPALRGSMHSLHLKRHPHPYHGPKDLCKPSTAPRASMRCRF